MTPHPDTEDQLVEQPALVLLSELGWTTVNARDEVKELESTSFACQPLFTAHLGDGTSQRLALDGQAVDGFDWRKIEAIVRAGAAGCTCSRVPYSRSVRLLHAVPAAPIPCTETAPAGCIPAQSVAVTAIPGVVFSPSDDGYVRAYDASIGRVIWEFYTIRDFDTVNRVQARGGSIEGPRVVVAGGLVFVTSGYSRNGSVPGNVLLVFAP